MTLAKIFSLFVVGAVLGLSQLCAQRAQLMDEIIETQALDAANAAYLVLVASGKLKENVSPAQALVALNQLNWTESLRDPQRPVTTAQFGYLLTRAFDLDGGFLFTWFPGPRYAHRELQFRGVIGGRVDPDAVLTGVEALRILGKVMDLPPSRGRP